MATESSTQIHIVSVPSSVGRNYADLFLISFVILFFELTCIRWFGSMVIFLTFFTNLVLMACFLGISVGCLTSFRQQDLINTVVPLTVWTVLLSCGVLVFFGGFGRVLVDIGGQGSPQQVFFGTEYRPKDPSYFVVPIELIAGVFFTMIALIFVGLGQVMGRRFNRIPNLVLAYTINIMGSLAGIVGFGTASYLRTSPVIWFGISIGLCLYFIDRPRKLQVARYAALLFLVGFFSGYGPTIFGSQILWSPYYKIAYNPGLKTIETNNISHQTMLPISELAPAYSVPHLLNHDAGGPPFKDVLIIGAGSGNDVQAALAQGAEHVDAVEIDPVINGIGVRDHPDHPYSDGRVSVHIDDGRSFLSGESRHFDLVTYALVDSLVLHSGYSSLRLESFLFTEQAFRDVKARLKPEGAFVMYNFYRQGWVVGRLVKMAEKVFGTRPLVFSLPYQEKITPQDSQANHFTVLIVGNTGSSTVQRIAATFEDKGFFWLNEKPKYNVSSNGYGLEPPAIAGSRPENWLKIAPVQVDTEGISLLPTDNWPFLYLREPMIPTLNVRWMLMVVAISGLVLYWFAPMRKFTPNGQMFFLGAGFMLLETKSVVQMALLFGSTWMVNSIIFFAILMMILLSNLFVILLRPKRRWGLFYGLLGASLVLNILVPMDYYLALPAAARMIISCSLVFVPIFFAGVIFALAFRDSQQPDIDIGSNIGGVILGGLSEYLSLVVGFNMLLVVALFYYLLSALIASRSLRLSLSGVLPLGSRLPAASG